MLCAVCVLKWSRMLFVICVRPRTFEPPIAHHVDIVWRWIVQKFYKFRNVLAHMKWMHMPCLMLRLHVCEGCWDTIVECRNDIHSIFTFSAPTFPHPGSSTRGGRYTIMCGFMHRELRPSSNLFPNVRRAGASLDWLDICTVSTSVNWDRFPPKCILFFCISIGKNGVLL